jgi:acetyl/propionyl-CoA carboxylase alpha subunit
MLAKAIAWAPTRTEAATMLAASLEAASIHGLVTNRHLLVAALRSADFIAGRTDTAFLDRNAGDLGAPSPTERVVELHALAAVLAQQTAVRAEGPTPTSVPLGWRNVGPAAQTVTFDVDGATVTSGVELAGVDVRQMAADFVVLEDLGARHRIAVHEVDGAIYVDSALGSTVLRRRPRFPDPTAAVQLGSLVSPLPGTVIQVLVEAGEEVSQGQSLLVIEAMKMQHTIRASHAGTVNRIERAVGDQVGAGEVLLVVDPASSPDAAKEG